MLSKNTSPILKNVMIFGLASINFARSSNSLRMRNYTCKDSWYANLLLSIETLNAGRKYFTCYKLYLQMTPLMSSNNTNLRIYMMPFKRYDFKRFDQEERYGALECMPIYISYIFIGM